MQTNKLFLHIGTHKTGTTSIQKVLHDYKGWLQTHGLVFPENSQFHGNRAHLSFSHALASQKASDQAKAQNFISDQNNKLGPNESIIISAEPIYRHVSGGRSWQGLVDNDYWDIRNHYLSDLAHTLDDYDVTVILYLRDYNYFISWLSNTLSKQNVWQGDVAELHELYGERFSYERQIGAILRYFSDVHIFRYEKAREQGLINHFFTAIGIPTPPKANETWERPTKPKSTL